MVIVPETSITSKHCDSVSVGRSSRLFSHRIHINLCNYPSNQKTSFLRALKLSIQNGLSNISVNCTMQTGIMNSWQYRFAAPSRTRRFETTRVFLSSHPDLKKKGCVRLDSIKKDWDQDFVCAFTHFFTSEKTNCVAYWVVDFQRLASNCSIHVWNIVLVEQQIY